MRTRQKKMTAYKRTVADDTNNRHNRAPRHDRLRRRNLLSRLRRSGVINAKGSVILAPHRLAKLLPVLATGQQRQFVQRLRRRPTATAYDTPEMTGIDMPDNSRLKTTKKGIQFLLHNSININR